MRPDIAILEDNRDRLAAMRICLRGLGVEQACIFFDSAYDMIGWLGGHLAGLRLLSLDHDLEMLPGPGGQTVNPGDGRIVAHFLAGRSPACPVIVHTSNIDCGSAMCLALEEAGWQVTRVYPLPGLSWIESQWCAAVASLLRPRGPGRWPR